MATRILFGNDDPVFSDDFLIKEGKIPQEFLDRIEEEYPHTFFDWPDTQGTMTIENEEWTVHYNSPFPLCFYHDQEFAFGIRKPESDVIVDLDSSEAVWTRLKTINPTEDPLNVMDGIFGEGTNRIVVERGDFPRFQTIGDIKISHTLKTTEYPNVYSLGNGYVLASSREIQIKKHGARTEQECWWMVAPEEYADEVSRRVLTVKLYDGPYPFQSRSTDIKLADPIPPTQKSEYVVYSYDREGIKGMYREIFQGVKPSKKAFVLQGDELLGYAKENDLRYVNEQLVGPGRVRYQFPLYSTKLLNVYWRGSEVNVWIRPDGEDWVDIADYDGKAVTSLEVELEVFTSLASLRVEYESVKDWYPVGRPVIDIVPSSMEGVAGNALVITGEQDEGLRQTVSLYTGLYEVCAYVGCFYGEAVVDVGSLQMLDWSLNKKQWNWREFVSENDEYDITITGNGQFSFEIDKPSIVEAGHSPWKGGDIDWYVDTDYERHNATESINNLETPLSLGEEKRWRVGVSASENIDREEISISNIYIDTYSTGRDQITKNIRWRGSNQSRLHFPNNVIASPVDAEYISLYGNGAIAWQQHNHFSDDDVKLTIDNSALSYSDEFIYRNVEINNEFWRVVITEDRATIYLNGELAGTMFGQGLPFRISKANTEDVQLDCSVGFVQLRRGMGPRFEGWDLGSYSASVEQSRAMTVWGITDEEALDNLPYYNITIN